MRLCPAAARGAASTLSPAAAPPSAPQGLEKKLSEISDPFHASYGQWLTAAQADAYTATPKNVASEVLAWATSTGAACTRLPESLKCSGSVAAIEALLDTELSLFAHTTSGHKIIRVAAGTPATVPESLTGKVIMVTGLLRFPIPRLGNSRPVDIMQALAAPDVDYSVVPETLNIMYNITTVDGSAASTQAPVEFQNYPAYVQADLDTFTKDVGVPDFTIPKSNIIGPFAASAQAESTLDEQVSARLLSRCCRLASTRSFTQCLRRPLSRIPPLQYIGAVGAGNTNWYWTVADWQYVRMRTSVCSVQRLPRA